MLILLTLLLAFSVTANYIVPGGRIPDTDGNPVNAHGGCILWDEPSSLYYLFGEYKTQQIPEGGGFAVYSSIDLAHWTFGGLVFKGNSSNPLLSPGDRVQRPKVLKGEDGMYHMWFANDNSTDLKWQGYAVSKNITGPYEYVDSIHPLGYWSSDYGAFADYKTGKQYAIFAGGLNGSVSNNVIGEYNANASDLSEIIYIFNLTDSEGPTVVQTDQSYWALMSHKTGYTPNNVRAWRSNSLSGPWSQPAFIAPRNTRTWNSQSGNNWRINGTKQTTYLYLGDHWLTKSVWDSRLTWLPITIDEEKQKLTIDWYDVYHLDVVTGEWWPINGTAYYAIDAEVAGGAFKQEANFASNNTIVTGINGNDSTVTFSKVQGAGTKQWVSFYYQNIDDSNFGDDVGGHPDLSPNRTLARVSWVVVNNDSSSLQTLVQEDTVEGLILSTPLLLDLQKGDNSITIGGLWNGQNNMGGDMDRIVVYPPE